MPKFWSDWRVAVKLQAAFGLVMLLFTTALASVLVVNDRVSALSSDRLGDYS